MRHTTTAILLAAVLTLALPLSVNAETETGSITGQVTARGTGAPLSGASIRLSSPGLVESAGTTSDADGHYAVGGLPLGAYAIEVTFVGYRAATTRDVAVESGQRVIVDFGLVTAPVELTETVVSASRRAENIVDAPISVSKIRGEEAIRNPAATSFATMIEHVRGIDYTQRGILTEKYNARGFNTAAGPNSRMVILLDGMPNSESGPAAALELGIPKDDLQDVEVITGPGSALYGADAVAGVVSVTTKDPRGTEGTTVTVAGGSRSTLRGRFRHAGTRSRWGWKIAGEHLQARDFEIVNTHYSKDSSMVITEDPNFDARGTRGRLGVYYYPDADSRIAFQTAAGSVDMIDFIDTGRMGYEGFRMHYQQLAYSSRSWHLNLYHVAEHNGQSYGIHMKARQMLSGLSAADAKEEARFSGTATIWGAEIRRKLSLSPLRTHLTYGADYRWWDNLKPFLEGGSFLAETVGVYGQSETDLSERVKLVLAGRLDDSNLFDARFSPKVALIYKPDPVMAVRATVNRAFRSPKPWNLAMVIPIGLDGMARGSGDGFQFGTTTGEPLPPEFEAGMPKLAPEKSTTYELGFKGVLRNSIYLDISTYQSRYRDFISSLVVVGDPGNGIFILDSQGELRVGEQTWTYINFGKRTIRGLDLGATAYATDRVTFTGNLSLIRAGRIENARGLDEPLNTPEAILNLGVAARDLPARGLTANLALRRVSGYDFSSGIRAGYVPQYTVVNLGLSYPLDLGVTCRLSVRNLLDNRHIEVIDGAELGRIIVAEVANEL